MRLSEPEINSIKVIFQRYFGPDSRVWVFGSRVRDGDYGGDIDLMVESSLAISEAFRAKVEAVSELQIRLGDQKIDLIVWNPLSKASLVVEEALSKGVRIA